MRKRVNRWLQGLALAVLLVSGNVRPVDASLVSACTFAGGGSGDCKIDPLNALNQLPVSGPEFSGLAAGSVNLGPGAPVGMGAAANVEGHFAFVGITVFMQDSITITDSFWAGQSFLYQFNFSLDGELNATNSFPEIQPGGAKWHGEASAALDGHFPGQHFEVRAKFSADGGYQPGNIAAPYNITFLVTGGVPFGYDLSLTAQAAVLNVACTHAAGGCNAPGTASASASYGNTLTILPARLFDLAGNELTNFTPLGESGINYRLVGQAASVPEPATAGLVTVAALLLGPVRAALHRRAARKCSSDTEEHGAVARGSLGSRAW